MHPNILRAGYNSWNDKGNADETLRQRAARVPGLHELSVPLGRVTQGGKKTVGALGGAVKDGGGGGGRGNKSMQGLLDRAHALLARGDQRL
jgi:hypothetical protein